MTEEFARDVDEEIRRLCEITERECDRLLDQTIDLILMRPGYNWLGPEREEVAELVMEYAQRRAELARWRTLVKPSQAAIARVK